MNAFLARLFFGKVEFQENEEYLEFRFKFLAIVLFSGALFTLIFLVGAYSNVNPITGGHLRSMSLFTLLAAALWIFLRGHKKRYFVIAWIYEIACLLEYVSAMLLVPEDELRLLWFYTNIPGVYILLGQRIGLAISLSTIVGLALGNAQLPHPYSENAIATALVSMTYLTLFFHVFGARSFYYYTRMRDANRRLLQMATHDMLTGILNARAYYERCDALINLSRRAQTPFAVLFIDLDHFKSINDNHGHAAGDIVLKSIAECLRSGIRQSDALGRIGGEEFSIFLPNTDINGACQLAEVLRRAIEACMPDIGSQRLKVTPSIGVAGGTGARDIMRDIQKRADEAMYAAKAAGRNRVTCLDAPTPITDAQISLEARTA